MNEKYDLKLLMVLAPKLQANNCHKWLSTYANIKLMRNFKFLIANMILELKSVVIDVSTNRQDSGLPTEAYVAVDTVREDGKPVEKEI